MRSNMFVLAIKYFTIDKKNEVSSRKYILHFLGRDVDLH